MSTTIDVHLRVTFDDQNHAEILLKFDNLTPGPLVVPDIRFDYDIDGTTVRENTQCARQPSPSSPRLASR